MKGNKRAILGFFGPYAFQMLALALIVAIFIIYFFILRGAASENVVIKAEDTALTPKLPLLLQISVSENQQSLYNILISDYLNSNGEFSKALTPLLTKMTIKPTPKYSTTVGWNLKVYSAKDKKELERLSVYTANPSVSFSKFEYSKEYLTVPIPNDPENPLILELHFYCSNCPDEYLRSYI